MARCSRPLCSQVSANLQQWSEPLVHYVFQRVPTLSTLEPRTGPTSGGTLLTIHGSALLGTHHLCRLTAAEPTEESAAAGLPSLVTPATYVGYDGSVLCTVPAIGALPNELAGARKLHVRVSVNGVQYAPTSHAFTYFDATAHVR